MSSLVQTFTHFDVLWDAWEQVRAKNSAPGVDGVSVRHFDLSAPSHLKDLQREIRRGLYRPLPLRGVWIPKARGGWRAAGVPVVRDRVAQRACHSLLAPRLEAHFAECSYAYRPGRSIADAIEQVEEWRDDGHAHLLESDIENCFGSIDRDRLLDTLAAYVAEPGLLQLVRAWLEAGVVWNSPGEAVEPLTSKDAKEDSSDLSCRLTPGADESGSTLSTPVMVPPLGIPQGDVLSPLLCNLFLHEFDETMLDERFKLVRYADDFLVLAASRERAEEALQTARESLAELGLRLHHAKTRVTGFESGFEYLGTRFIGRMALPLVRRERCRPNGECDVIFVPGYPSAPRRQPDAMKPAPPEMRGTVAVSSQLALVSQHAASSGVARARAALHTPLAQAMTKALTEKKRRERRRVRQDVETPWETTYLV